MEIWNLQQQQQQQQPGANPIHWRFKYRTCELRNHSNSRHLNILFSDAQFHLNSRHFFFPLFWYPIDQLTNIVHFLNGGLNTGPFKYQYYYPPFEYLTAQNLDPSPVELFTPWRKFTYLSLSSKML